MAITRYISDRFAGLTSDVKPSGLSDGAEFQELTAPFNRYAYISASGGWVLTSSGSSITNYYPSDSNPSGYLTGVGRMIVLCSAYTPTTTGADTAEVPIPFPVDGYSTMPWYMRRATFRVGTNGGTPSVKLESSTGLGVFSVFNTFTTLSLTSGQYEISASGYLGTITGGHKLRFNVISTGSLNWTITAEISSI